ncbi:tyrosine-type recombinase/integrase [uncultured Parasutterella sp.]|uniref:tyrosine-type recombinase/integrase n=1 Tax=uncultured Parasutterella sp. TaxID=1263098 RepID=UPI00259A4ADA|nr:tyrosine-type recombinase/integrase [uncultured Parasutterella sp.]
MLTTKKIVTLKPKARRYQITDQLGLVLRVQTTGVKSWVLRIPRNGGVKDITLGHWPDISLMQARQMARTKRLELELEPPDSYTLRDAFKFWCSKKKGRILSYRDEKLRLEKYIISKIGNRQLDTITPPLIIRIVEPIEKSGKQSTVKRLLMRTREIFDMSVNAGFISANPIAKITKVFPVPKVKHMPAVDWKELPIVMSQIEALAPPKYRLLFYFSLATLLRPGEVVSIRLNWIDAESITIPAEKMKMKRAHRVPLTPYLKEIISQAKSIRKNKRSPYLFPATCASKPISSQSLAKWLHDQDAFRDRLVAHGLRSIGRSWFADNGIPFEIAEACLAHVVGSQVVRAYQRSDFFESRFQVMLQWHEFIRKCAECAKKPEPPLINTDTP